MTLLLLLACSPPTVPDTAAEVCVGPDAVTWDNWGEDFFTTYCDACHSSRTPDRRGAPEASVFDTEAQTIGAQRLVGFGYPPQLPPERTAELLAALPKALKWMGRR